MSLWCVHFWASECSRICAVWYRVKQSSGLPKSSSKAAVWHCYLKDNQWKNVSGKSFKKLSINYVTKIGLNLHSIVLKNYANSVKLEEFWQPLFCISILTLNTENKATFKYQNLISKFLTLHWIDIFNMKTTINLITLNFELGILA